MSAEELADRLIALSEAGGPIDWREMREQILAEHKKAPDESDRVLCLNLHHALLNFAERNANLASLRRPNPLAWPQS